MKKIAIKAESWADMKPAIDLIRGTGQTVVKRKDEHKGADFNILCNGIPCPIIESYSSGDDWQYVSKRVNLYDYPSMLVFTMPEDMDKLKEALGVETNKYALCVRNNNGCFKDFFNVGEIYNIKSLDIDKFSVIGNCTDRIYRAFEYDAYDKSCNTCFELSTKEAYEAQEAKKKEPELGALEYDLKKQSVLINEPKVEIETKDKRIAELEKNLIIMCELGSKVLG